MAVTVLALLVVHFLLIINYDRFCFDSNIYLALFVCLPFWSQVLLVAGRWFGSTSIVQRSLSIEKQKRVRALLLLIEKLKIETTFFKCLSVVPSCLRLHLIRCQLKRPDIGT